MADPRPNDDDTLPGHPFRPGGQGAAPAEPGAWADTDNSLFAATMVIPAGQPADSGGRTETAAEYSPSLPRRGVLPGESALPMGTLPGNINAPGEKMQQVGRYQILERIGRGGMATVFKANDPSIGRDVAIKFLHASLCEGEDYRGRFLQEARAAGGLSHPNIVIVHDVGEIEGRPYMAMELLSGISLAEELEIAKTIPVRDALVMAIQLARALDYAHGKGIVHRDIKPANIVRLAGSRTIKVTDFGIAHMDGASESSLRTRAGDVLGTPQYMSPEQTRGERLDGRSDLFSAGIVLYQMIIGSRPFRGDSLVAVATKIASEPPTPIPRERSDIPPALRRVIDRCLAKNPAQRFQSGAELAEALDKVLREMDEEAHDRSRPRIMPLRVKWAAMMAALVALVMAVAATLITHRQVQALMSQALDYGASTTRFMAAQNAALVLGEEWEAVEVLVEKVMKTGDYERITVADAYGVVRASSDTTLVGLPYKPMAGEPLGERDKVVAERYFVAGEPMLGFDVPITFQDQTAGRVMVGIPERPLTEVARLSIALMIALALVTVLAVAVAMYFVANWFAKPIKLVRESMGEIAKGRFDHRINEQRNDEFGLLYGAFDDMAAALQDRDAKAEPQQPPPPAR
ncbi:protein kinase domain-containing protein [Pseudorhodoferax sp.]|uniref:protein kinase domain-containing protein n=1 Tax=Pseudorhodoferax sp. TaxID=1993553 RepID=UPI002DD67999|nr:protein kinase [Pseudorhodoferax sp.]